MSMVSPPIRLPDATIACFDVPMICLAPAGNVEIWEIQAILRILFASNPIHPVHESFSFADLADAGTNQESMPRGFYLVDATEVPIYEGSLGWANRLINAGSSVFAVTQPRCLKSLVTGDLLYPKDVGALLFARASNDIRVSILKNSEITQDFLFSKVHFLTALKQEDRDLCENNQVEDSTYQALLDVRFRLSYDDHVAGVPFRLLKSGVAFNKKILPL